MVSQKQKTIAGKQRFQQASKRIANTPPLYDRQIEAIGIGNDTLIVPWNPVSWVKSKLWTGLLYPMDIFCLMYLNLITLLLIFHHQHIENWLHHTLSYALFSLGIFALLFLNQKFSNQKWLRAFRVVYPMAVIAYGWGTITELVKLIYGTYWTTHWVVYFDKIIFNTYPTIWCEQFYSPWLDELMNIFYSGYYLFMPLTVLILLFRGKYNQLTYVLSLVSFTYLGNFILFYLFPTVSPQITPEISALSSNTYSGYWASSITKWIQTKGSILGGAFPSSHVSGAVIWALAVIDISRKTGIFMAICVPGIAVSTVYLGYHHALDPIAGIIWGFLSYKLIASRCSYLIFFQNRRHEK